MKTKLIEIDVAKLDPNAIHLIVFNSSTLTLERMRDVARQMDSLGIKAIYTESVDPQNALKVYEIPREEQ